MSARTMKTSYDLRDESKSLFAILVALRAGFLVLCAHILDLIVPLGSSPTFIGICAALGVVVASRASFSPLASRGAVLLLALFYLSVPIGFRILELIPLPGAAGIFFFYSIGEHAQLAALAFSLSAACTWAFWRMRHYPTFESLSLALAIIWLLSGHRNFHFDKPRIINSIAWRLGVNELAVFVAFGATLFLGLLVYLYLSVSERRPIPGADVAVVEKNYAQPWWKHLGAALIGLSAVFILSKTIYQQYSTLALNRTANGVGSESSEGMSPLGFHSALGGTNQPAAVVRLDGDYKANPFSPMMYLRESALSGFNGKEMVLANRMFDTDVSRTSPLEQFQGTPDVELEQRQPLQYSVYVLAEQRQAFAVDYPLSIQPLKNPNPNRFKSAYRAYSMAPAFALGIDAVGSAAVGDHRWPDYVRQHYLVPHADIRYAELAKKIAGQLAHPVEMAYALTTYLNEKAIYTLTPGHTVAADEDPVAPFLFGDMRGYCVHFAHATVYMLRSLGIPSRVATGYLTDLSQARDGHILLRMSDRHAWAEIYIDRLGWIPFDTQPKQVESHAETQVDMKLLEELMQMLGPDEETLPKDVAKDEEGLKDESPYTFSLPISWLWYGLATVAGALLVLKLYLWYSWALPSSAVVKARRAYRSSLARLIDLGIPRLEGETRQEYQRRVESTLQRAPLLPTTSLINQLRFGNAADKAIESGLNLYRGERDLLRHVALWRRILAGLNPLSCLYALRAFRW